MLHQPHNLLEYALESKPRTHQNFQEGMVRTREQQLGKLAGNDEGLATEGVAGQVHIPVHMFWGLK
jgi:hypothetical protein